MSKKAHPANRAKSECCAFTKKDRFCTLMACLSGNVRNTDIDLRI